MKLTILDTGTNTAKRNMQLDQELLASLEAGGNSILHFYAWEKPSITYGYFAKIDQLIDLSACQKLGIDVAKRVTGGGVTLHFTDFAFSFLMPKGHPKFSENTLKNYEFVNQIVKRAYLKVNQNLKELQIFKQDACSNGPNCYNFCMAKPTQYDVVIDAKKVGGAAQRKKQNGYLHHGTLSVAYPNKSVLSQILKNEALEAAIFQNSYALVKDHTKIKEVECERKKLKEALATFFEKELM